MTADEIRMTFGHNSVYGDAYHDALNNHTAPMLALQILAMGELAAQIAEMNELKREESGHGPHCDCETCAVGQQGKYKPR